MSNGWCVFDDYFLVVIYVVFMGGLIMDIYFKVAFFLMLFAAGLALSVVISQRALIKKMREENGLNGDLFAKLERDVLQVKRRCAIEIAERREAVRQVNTLAQENYELRRRWEGIDAFSKERGGRPYSPAEYVAMGVGMITEGKGNVEVRRVPTMEQVPDFGQSSDGGQASTENN